MTKDEFLSQMERALAPLAPHDRIDILGDYAEHFRAGEESGKTPEEIASALGDPNELAQSFLEQHGIASPPKTAYSAPAQNSVPPVGGTAPVGGEYPPNGAYVQGNTPPNTVPPSNGYAPPPPYSRATYTSPAGGQRAGYSTPAGESNQALAIVLVILVNVFVGVPIVTGVGGALLAIPGHGDRLFLRSNRIICFVGGTHGAAGYRWRNDLPWRGIFGVKHVACCSDHYAGQDNRKSTHPLCTILHAYLP